MTGRWKCFGYPDRHNRDHHRPGPDALGTVECVAEPLRRLAYIELPAPDEHFASWIRRTSIALHLPAGRLLEDLGVSDTTNSSDVRVRNWGVRLTPDAETALVATTGLPTPTARTLRPVKIELGSPVA